MTGKILITGATGFIGKHCVKYLSKQGYELICLSRQNNSISTLNIIWQQCDLLDSSRLKKIISDLRPVYLIHAAWYVKHNDYWNSASNLDFIRATANLWQFFLQNGGKRAVFLGTCAEDVDVYVSKTNKNIYGKSKARTAEIISLINEAYGENGSYMWARIHNVYGPGEGKNKIISYLIRCFKNNIPPEIKNPHTIYYLIYIKNLVVLICNSLFSSLVGVRDFAQNIRCNMADLAVYIHENFFPESYEPIINKYDETQIIDSLLPRGDFDWIKNLGISSNFISFSQSIEECISSEDK